MKKIFLLMFVVMPWRSAFSADLCQAIALRDVAAIENPDSILKRGDYDTAITQYNIKKQSGMTVFCSHGGYCYPTHVLVDGKKIEVLKLTNCKIGKWEFEDSDETSYSVEMDRSKNSAADLQWDDLDNKFLTMGLCSACAGSVTTHYLKDPASPCAKLAKKALKGDHEALNELKEFPSYCH